MGLLKIIGIQKYTLKNKFAKTCLFTLELSWQIIQGLGDLYPYNTFLKENWGVVLS